MKTVSDGIDNRPAILVVLTYGMNIRDVVLNRALWTYLRSQYQIDVWTPVQVDDRRSLGITRVLDFAPGRRWLPSGLASRIRSLALSIVQQMRYCDFYFFTGLVHILNWSYSLTYNLPTHRKKWWYLYHCLNQTSFGEPLRRFALRCVASHPLRREARKRSYRFVLVTHPRENNNQIAAIVSASVGIPIVLAPLGLDNMTHGGTPIIEPDLALLWGDMQVEEHYRYLLPFNPNLDRTTVVAAGSLVYDNYLAAVEPEAAFREQHGIGPDEDIIVFAAHVESYYAHQCEQAAWIVDFIRTRKLRARLLVRVRPGIDEEMWRAFRDANADVVSLQVPRGVAYDKSNRRTSFRLSNEERDVAVYASTLRYARLLVSAGLSTTYTDAHLFRTPALTVLCDSPAPGTLFTRTKFYQYFCVDYPLYAKYQVAYNRCEVEKFLESFFSSRRPDEFVSDEIFRWQAVDRLGLSGQRAVAALQKMFSEPAGPAARAHLPEVARRII